MKKIEDIIRNNLASFDKSEPSSEHFDNFQRKLSGMHSEQREGWFSRHSLSLRIAASILIFVTFGILYYSNSFDFVRNTISDQIAQADLPIEVKEVMEYYNVITDNQLDQIDQLAVSNDEAERVREKAKTELANLEEYNTMLKQEYAANPNNEKITNALIQNQQKKAELMDVIINTLSTIN
jgi:hypothetical protein